jgi:hypothetical protein
VKVNGVLIFVSWDELLRLFCDSFVDKILFLDIPFFILPYSYGLPNDMLFYELRIEFLSLPEEIKSPLSIE